MRLSLGDNSISREFRVCFPLHSSNHQTLISTRQHTSAKGLLLAALTLIVCFRGLCERTLLPLLSTPQGKVDAGQDVVVLLSFLNSGSVPLRGAYPPHLDVDAQMGTNSSRLVAIADLDVATYNILPQGFGTAAYRVKLPPDWTGLVTLTAPGVPGSALQIRVDSAGPMKVESIGPSSAEQPTKQATELGQAVSKGNQKQKTASSGHSELGRDLQKTPDHLGLSKEVEFFRDHFFGYEPMYIITGPDHPNTKLQFSFKYKLIGEDSWLASEVPAVRGAYFAYTQTSLWDTSALSAPFLDSSYKPEFLYQWQDIWRRGNFPDWLRFDLDGALAHESNGRDGTNSRTINMVYIRPKVVFGEDGGWQVTLAPKLWFYLGSLSDNPDISSYRGYAELSMRAGKEESWMVDGRLRAGNALDRANVLVAVSYPLRHLTGRWLNGFLYGEYFNGYGESILKYQERSWTFRIGYALFR